MRSIPTLCGLKHSHTHVLPEIETNESSAVGMSAEAMVNATMGYLAPGELLYIATDEAHAEFFDPFRARQVPPYARLR